MKSFTGILSAISLIALFASTASAQLIVREYNFETDTEGWTTAGSDPYADFGQQTATGGTEGVLFGVQASGNDPQLSLPPDAQSVSLPAGYTWDTAVFRLRHLESDGEGGWNPVAFTNNIGMVFVKQGDNIRADDSRWVETVDPDDSTWTIVTLDISDRGDLATTFNRFDPTGTADHIGLAFELDYAQFTAVPEPSIYAAIFGVLALGGVLIRRRLIKS